MNDDLSLNLEAVEPVAQHLVKNHVNGVFVCGTTGESMLLSVAERKIVICGREGFIFSLLKNGLRLDISMVCVLLFTSVMKF